MLYTPFLDFFFRFLHEVSWSWIFRLWKIDLIFVFNLKPNCIGVYLDYSERDSKKEKRHPILFMRSNFQYLRQGKCWLSLLVTVAVYPDMCSLNHRHFCRFCETFSSFHVLTGRPFFIKFFDAATVCSVGYWLDGQNFAVSLRFSLAESTGATQNDPDHCHVYRVLPTPCYQLNIPS